MKKILLSLFVGFVGIISFCDATVFQSYSGFCNNKDNFCLSTTYPDLNGCNGKYYFVMLLSGDVNWNLRFPGIGFNSTSQNSFFGQAFDCSNNRFSFVDRSDNGFDYVIKFVDYDEILNIGLGGGGSCPECPEVNTGEILSGYILESEIDSNYCVNNDLCPVYENNSLLYINTIEHQSAPVINIDIPLEYDWDSSIDSGVFNLVISGNNVDYEYIDGIITAQNVKPDSGTLNKIITELIPLFVPGLVIILFIWFVFRFIKKIF